MSTQPIRVFISKEDGGGNFPSPKTCRKIDGGDGEYPNFPCKKLELIPGLVKTPLSRPPDPVVKSYAFYFPFDRDVEVTVETPMDLKKTIAVWGGRQVLIRGLGNGKLEMKRSAPQACDETELACRNALRDFKPAINAAVVIDSPRASVMIENLKIYANGSFTDGVVFRQSPATRPRSEGVDIFMSHFGAYGIGGAYAGLHGDMVQLQSGTYRNLFFFDIEGSTGYQGFYVPNRPKGSPTLCGIASELIPGENPKKLRELVRSCVSPIYVKGKSFLQNVVLRPLEASVCPNCIKPYIGLYTKDEDIKLASGAIYETPAYETYLNNVTFYKDPRAEVSWYAVPHPRSSTPEGEINMSIETRRVINGETERAINGWLRIETESEACAARD